jgi:hypothetical protein
MKLGRPELKAEDIKKPFGATLQKKVIDELGRDYCKSIAEEAVNKEYKKQMR